MKITVRFPDDAEHIHDDLQKASEENHRSLNSEIIHALDYYLKHAPETKVIRDQKETKRN